MNEVDNIRLIQENLDIAQIKKLVLTSTKPYQIELNAICRGDNIKEYLSTYKAYAIVLHNEYVALLTSRENDDYIWINDLVIKKGLDNTSRKQVWNLLFDYIKSKNYIRFTTYERLIPFYSHYIKSVFYNGYNHYFSLLRFPDIDFKYIHTGITKKNREYIAFIGYNEYYEYKNFVNGRTIGISNESGEIFFYLKSIGGKAYLISYICDALLNDTEILIGEQQLRLNCIHLNGKKIEISSKDLSYYTEYISLKITVRALQTTYIFEPSICISDCIKLSSNGKISSKLNKTYMALNVIESSLYNRQLHCALGRYDNYLPLDEISSLKYIVSPYYPDITYIEYNGISLLPSHSEFYSKINHTGLFGLLTLKTPQGSFAIEQPWKQLIKTNNNLQYVTFLQKCKIICNISICKNHISIDYIFYNNGIARTYIDLAYNVIVSTDIEPVSNNNKCRPSTGVIAIHNRFERYIYQNGYKAALIKESGAVNPNGFSTIHLDLEVQ